MKETVLSAVTRYAGKKQEFDVIQVTIYLYNILNVFLSYSSSYSWLFFSVGVLNGDYP